MFIFSLAFSRSIPLSVCKICKTSGIVASCWCHVRQTREYLYLDYIWFTNVWRSLYLLRQNWDFIFMTAARSGMESIHIAAWKIFSEFPSVNLSLPRAKTVNRAVKRPVNGLLCPERHRYSLHTALIKST